MVADDTGGYDITTSPSSCPLLCLSPAQPAVPPDRIDGWDVSHEAAKLTMQDHSHRSSLCRTILTDIITSQSLQTFRSSKFVVRVAFSPDGAFIATASYDHNIVIYAATSPYHPPDDDEDATPLDETDDPALARDPGLRYTEVRRLKVDSNPETLLFHPKSHWLMYTVRASHLLYYVKLDPSWEVKTKSFNPHPMDTHVSFAVLHLALHPSGRVIACQTGDHRGGSGERILLYGVEPEDTERLECLWTGSEGDDFVLPRMAWLRDGSGLM